MQLSNIVVIFIFTKSVQLSGSGTICANKSGVGPNSINLMVRLVLSGGNLTPQSAIIKVWIWLYSYSFDTEPEPICDLYSRTVDLEHLSVTDGSFAITRLLDDIGKQQQQQQHDKAKQHQQIHVKAKQQQEIRGTGKQQQQIYVLVNNNNKYIIRLNNNNKYMILVNNNNNSNNMM